MFKYGKIVSFFKILKSKALRKSQVSREHLVNVDREYIEILDENPELFNSDDYLNPKLYTTYCSVKYIVENSVEGDLVECGVYKGRMIVMMCLTLLKFNDSSRRVYLFDTFSGMTGCSEFDYKPNRKYYTYEYNLNKQEQMQRGDINLRCYSPKDEVLKYVHSTGYPDQMIYAIQGDVLETLPMPDIKKISFLRLDTDWYESTKHELNVLYPLLVKFGVLSQDDYGSWNGAKKATSEFFKENKIKPLLFRMGDSEVATIKLY